MNKHDENEKHIMQQRDSHISIYLLWPCLSGLAISLIMSISISGIVAIVGGSLRVFATTFGISFFAILAISTLTIFSLAVCQWYMPLWLERAKLANNDYEYDDDEIVDGDYVAEPRFVAVPLSKRQKMIAPKIPQNDDKHILAKMKAAIAPPTAPQSLTKDIDGIAPKAAKWIVEFYDVTTKLYGYKTLSRNAFKLCYPSGYKRLHAKFVGTQDKPGIWRQWKLLDKGARKSVVFAYDLQEILKIDNDVWQYAMSKNQMLDDGTKVTYTSRCVGNKQNSHSPIDGTNTTT